MTLRWWRRWIWFSQDAGPPLHLFAMRPDRTSIGKRTGKAKCGFVLRTDESAESPDTPKRSECCKKCLRLAKEAGAR